LDWGGNGALRKNICITKARRDYSKNGWGQAALKVLGSPGGREGELFRLRQIFRKLGGLSIVKKNDTGGMTRSKLSENLPKKRKK